MRIRGVVVDEHAQTIADALVTASRADGKPCLTTRSDDDGCFAFEIEPDDEDCTVIRAQWNGRTSEATHQRDDTPGGSSLTIEIVPTVALLGHITDENGQPVHGALVATWGSKHTTTDASGGYRLDGLRPGNVHLHAWRNGLQLQRATVVVDEGARLDWTLQPASGRWIRFTLSKETPSDIRPRWSLWCHHPIHLHLEGTFPDSREVTLGGLPTDHLLRGAVWSKELQADPTNHYLEPDPRVGLIEWRTHLAPATKEVVTGVIVDEHQQPLPGTDVVVSGTCVANDTTCTSDAHGRFVCEFDRRPDDSLEDDLIFTLVDKDRVIDDGDGEAWFNPRCRGSAYRPHSPGADFMLRTVPSAGVRGRVIRGGAAVSGALVTLMVQWAPQDKPHTSRVDATEADDDGQFQFRGLHPAIGEGLFVRVQATGVDIVSDIFTLGEGAMVALPDLDAKPLATVSGRLLDANGNALPAACVSLIEVNGRLNEWGNRGTETDSQGGFVIHNVRPGRYDVEATASSDALDSACTVIARDRSVQTGETMHLGDLTI